MSGEKDLIGDAYNPAIYYFFSYPDDTAPADYLYFRMRLSETPLSGGRNLKPFGWAVDIDTDGNYADYEYRHGSNQGNTSNCL